MVFRLSFPWLWVLAACCGAPLVRSRTRARKRVRPSPATIDAHQIHGPRPETCETKVSTAAATEVATRRGQLREAVMSATASAGQR